MRYVQLAFTDRRPRGGRGRVFPRPVAVALASVPAPTAARGTDGGPGGGSSASAADDAGGGIEIPDHIEDGLREHGIDVDRWKDGAWQDWDRGD